MNDSGQRRGCYQKIWLGAEAPCFPTLLYFRVGAPSIHQAPPRSPVSSALSSRQATVSGGLLHSLIRLVSPVPVKVHTAATATYDIHVDA